MKNLKKVKNVQVIPKLKLHKIKGGIVIIEDTSAV